MQKEVVLHSGDDVEKIVKYYYWLKDRYAKNHKAFSAIVYDTETKTTIELKDKYGKI